MKNRIIGILGGLFCGFVAAIPWVLVYHFMSSILSILAIPIAMGFLFGYRHLKGPIDKALPIIIAVASLFIIIVTTLITIPASMLIDEGLPISFGLIMELYGFHEVRMAALQDMAFSVVFTLLGIGGVIRNIKYEIGVEPSREHRAVRNNFQAGILEGETMLIRTRFEQCGAMSADMAVSYDTLELSPNLSDAFDYMRKKAIVRESQGLYYYNENGKR